jgi:nucleoside-diphosphate-sugar epimerase
LSTRHALVTGGSGYFGSLLVGALCRHGYRVSVFDLCDAEDRPPEVTLWQGDVRDAAVVARACVSIDVIFHCVAQVPLAKNDELFFEVNATGTDNVLRAARERDVGKVVLVSSSAVFGVPTQNPIDETVQPAPQEAYGKAKLEAEQVAARFARDGLDVSIVRPRTILGHGRLGIFQILFEWVRTGRPVYLLGRGDNRYQLVHADDLAEACIRAGELAGSDTFNIGTDRFGTMKEALAALIAHAGTKSRLRSLPAAATARMMDLTGALGLSPLAPYHALMYGREIFFDLAKAKSKLRFLPRYSNEEMLIESYDWYLAHREEVLRRGGAQSLHRSPVKRGILRLLEYLP